MFNYYKTAAERASAAKSAALHAADQRARAETDAAWQRCRDVMPDEVAYAVEERARAALRAAQGSTPYKPTPIGGPEASRRRQQAPMPVSEASITPKRTPNTGKATLGVAKAAQR